jgi:hypothetical protein
MLPLGLLINLYICLTTYNNTTIEFNKLKGCTVNTLI